MPEWRMNDDPFIQGTHGSSFCKIPGNSLCTPGKRAFEAGFHDSFSDIDLSVKVCLPSDGSVTPDQYMKQIDRFGVSIDTALGWYFVSENKIYRIIFRDGMRYDFGFEFEYADHMKLDLGKQPDAGEQNDNWLI